ncbi:MAG: hypothetical protein LUD19_06345 [Clostridia bacterium]|nr:hypothetical protein [Clostridia bacterium]
MSKYIFVSAFSGKSKEKQNPFTRVTVAKMEDGGNVRMYDLFTTNGKTLPNQTQLKFGDTVELGFQPSDYPGGRSSLSDVRVISPSPF